MNRPKIVLFGCTRLSEDILRDILNMKNAEVVGVVTSPEAFVISYSDKPVKNYNFANLGKFKSEVPWVHVFDKSAEDATKTLKDKLQLYQIDIILVVGWYYMVPKSIRELAQFGAWGLHASLLPKYAGGAPVVWAMINQEKETGISLFRLEDGVDDGPIIDQQKIEIEENEYISDVLHKVTIASKESINKVLAQYPNFIFSKQLDGERKVWPQRKPSDGEIDLTQSADRVLAFIRAQSRPYPGAFINKDGKKHIVWKARKTELPTSSDLFFKCGDGVYLEVVDSSIEG